MLWLWRVARAALHRFIAFMSCATTAEHNERTVDKCHSCHRAAMHPPASMLLSGQLKVLGCCLAAPNSCFAADMIMQLQP
jgi:hypothetical protein